MQVKIRGPPAEEIDAVAAKLPRARAGQDELLPRLLLDEQMHHLEQLRQLLHFVRPAPAAGRDSPSTKSRKRSGRAANSRCVRRVEQIDPEAFRGTRGGVHSVLPVPRGPSRKK